MLDVKVGSGAFMKPRRARELAQTMVELGTAHGVPTIALLTDMSTPLGRTAGNALEVAESVEVLAGGGPADVVELTLALAREMLRRPGSTSTRPTRCATASDAGSPAALRGSAFFSQLQPQHWLRRVRGGGSRTRTYEGYASGFTVRPLCRSGHSPLRTRPEAWFRRLRPVARTVLAKSLLDGPAQC